MVTYKFFSDLPLPTPYFWDPIFGPCGPSQGREKYKVPKGHFSPLPALCTAIYTVKIFFGFSKNFDFVMNIGPNHGNLQIFFRPPLTYPSPQDPHFFSPAPTF